MTGFLNRHYSILKLIVLCFVVFRCADNVPDKNVVAYSKNNFVITKSDLDSYCSKKYPFKKKNSISSIEYHEALTDLIKNQLKILEAYELKYNSDSLIIKNLQPDINRVLFSQYYKNKIYSKYVNNQAKRLYYKKICKEIDYLQFIVYKENQSRAQALNKINQWHSQINSQPILSMGKLNKGFCWKDANTYLLKSLFKMEDGEVSNIIESDDSFQFFKIVDVTYNFSKPYQTLEPVIEEDLQKKYSNYLVKDLDALLNTCGNSSCFKWNEMVLDTIVQLFEGKEFNENNYKKLLETCRSLNRNECLFSFEDQSYSTGYLQTLLINYSFRVMPDAEDKYYLKQFIIGAFQNQCIVQIAKDLGYDKDILKSDALKNSLHKALIRKYNQVQIEPNIPIADSTNLLNFYHLFKDSLYYQQTSVTVKVALFNHQSEASHSWDLIEKGKSIEQLRKRKTIQSYEKTRTDEVINTFGYGHLNIGNVAIELKNNEHAGPISFVDDQGDSLYAIIKYLNGQSAKQLSYNEVHSKVKKDYYHHHFNIIERKKMNRLRKKYRVKEIGRNLL